MNDKRNNILSQIYLSNVSMVKNGHKSNAGLVTTITWSDTMYNPPEQHACNMPLMKYGIHHTFS